MLKQHSAPCALLHQVVGVLLFFSLIGTAWANDNACTVRSAQMGRWGIQLDQRDIFTKPGNDFYQHVNGEWLATTQIPGQKTRYGSFNRLADTASQQVRQILEHLNKTDPPPNSPTQRAADLYQAWMDVAAANKTGFKPVVSALKAIGTASTKDDLARLMGQATLDIGGITDPNIGIDVKNPKTYVTYLSQTQLGLPTRTYYLSDQKRFKKIRQAYTGYIAKLFKLADMKNGQRAANRILALETRMAKVEWKPAKQRNRSLTYNPVSIDKLESSAPGFPWHTWLEARGLAKRPKLVLRENDAIKSLAKIFNDTSLAILKRYAQFRLLNANAKFLSKTFDHAHFDFYGKTLNGQPEQKDRWKRGVYLVNHTVGKAVGRIYVKKHFSPAAKQQMEKLVANLKAAFRDRLKNKITWMTPSTRKKALKKLDAFNAKIAYPKKWKTYKGMKITPDHLYADIKSARQWHWQYDLDKLGGPVNPNEWFMNPQTINAYYSPSRNEIVFPAAILQPPFFDPNADRAVNYGGIGAVIGHEMTHGFDDQGHKSDGQGRLRNWWTPKDTKRFNALAKRLGKQYAQYEPVKGYHVDPDLTMGENIADLGGLTIAHEAYHRSYHGKKPPVIDGYTGDQRLFLSWAQVWRTRYRQDALINQLKSDPHSPAQNRTNGVLRNLYSWYKAFNVKPGNKLYLPKDKRVTIW